MKIDYDIWGNMLIFAIAMIVFALISGCVSYYAANTQVHAQLAACEARYAESKKK